MKRLRLVCLALLITVVGCATSPIPEGYTGPRSTLSDTATMETNFRAAYFYVAQVDGRPIKTNLQSFREANRGRGMSISAYSMQREVPSGRTKLRLEGRHAYGAPIQEIVMALSMRSVDAELEVALQPSVRYTVRGVLSEGKDEIWLEVEGTGERVGTLVKK